MEDFRTLAEVAKAAQRNLDKNNWDYLVGGADSEGAIRRNRLALDSLQFKPRVLNDVSTIVTSASLLEAELRIPVILPPIGSVQVFDAGGTVAVAEAAATFGTMMVLSSSAQPEFEEVAAATSAPKIYQLYLTGDQAWMDDIISRSIDAGYVGFCLTVDTQMYSRRERDIIKRFIPGSGRRAGASDFNYQSSMSWDTVAHIKDKFDIPLALKGIQRGDDAARAVEAGVDIVWVSNHGGRQLDHARGCADIMPEVVDAVGGRCPIVMDGGVMRGADVVKGLCLGADAVATGRFLGLAMAAGGTEAVVRALEILEQEMRIVMGLMGIASVEDLSADLIEKSVPLPGSAGVLDALPLLHEGY